MTLAWGFSKGALNRPAVVKAAGDDAFMPPKPLGPLLYIQRDAVQRQKAIASTVVCLFFGTRPSAVVRGIIFVVVDTLKPSALWRVLHIGEKGRKGISPFSADANPPRAVSGERRVLFAVASALHSIPGPVFFRLCRLAQSMCLRLRRVSPLRKRHAPARSRVAAPKIAGLRNLFATAIAKTLPCRQPLFVRPGIALHNQFAKSMTAQINTLHNIAFRICDALIVTQGNRYAHV